MKNKTLRILSLALATATLSTSTPVFAYDVDEHDNSIESAQYQNTEDEDFNNATNVFAQIGSEYKVTIPKVVVLSGVSKAASYYVKVTGDIAGYEKIKVVPEDSFKLSAKNKADETATINQDKTTWTVHDFDTDANGQISAEDITAGKWTGAFNFNINLEDTTVPKALAAGLYDENDNLIKSWDELVELGILAVDENGVLRRTGGTHQDKFAENNLSGKLVIPNSVTSISYGAFGGCKSLTSITIPNSVTSIKFSAFGSCESLESITLSESLTSIDANVFWGCTSLKSITIPDSVTSIGNMAFMNCASLESATIGNSVTSIGDYVFESCTSLESIAYRGVSYTDKNTLNNKLKSDGVATADVWN